MKVERGTSQVFFGHLPGQTADINGKVWRVIRWGDPVALPFDQEAVRRAIVGAAGAWAAAGKDDGLTAELMKGRAVEVVGLNRRLGVEVELFPQLWRCRKCSRLGTSGSASCTCGNQRHAQLPYVMYHSCGAVQEPYPPRCKTHKDVAMDKPGTATAREFHFWCPACPGRKTVSWGFPFRACACGDGGMSLTVHRAAVVYTPRFAVMVNPPDPGAAARMRAGGGGARALEWIVDGMTTMDPSLSGQTVAGLIETLRRSGISEGTARDLARQAAARGEISDKGDVTATALPERTAEGAQEEALALVSAIAGGRRTVADMCERTTPPLRTLYEGAYLAAINEARLEAIEFLPHFPVATVAFGFTRGDSRPGQSRLVPFRHQGNLTAYADLNRTEALLFRLDPRVVYGWLAARGLVPAAAPLRSRDARRRILELVEIPQATDENSQDLGTALVGLLHSFAHRAVRRLAAYAGIERDSLAEYLVPHHLSFVIYAATRGEFVLGGLQAVFETSLDRYLADFMAGESRCALDPGCRNGGGACMACLHLGESSCRWFNRFLNRAHLFGPNGFLR